MKKLALGIIIGVLAVAAVASATTLNITNLPASGTLTNTLLDSRFTQIESWANGNIDNANISGSAAIAVSKLANQYENVALPVQIDSCATASTVFVTELPYAAELVGCSARCVAAAGAACDAVANHTINFTVAGATQCSVALGAGDLSAVETTTAAASVSANADLGINITETAAGTCAKIDATMHLKVQHRT